jgi:hypothetical protein
MTAARLAELASIRLRFHECVDRVIALLATLEDTSDPVRRHALLAEVDMWRASAVAIEAAYLRLVAPGVGERGDRQCEAAP